MGRLQSCANLGVCATVLHATCVVAAGSALSTSLGKAENGMAEEEWTKFIDLPNDEEACRDAISTPPSTPLVPKPGCISFTSEEVLKEFISRLPQDVLNSYRDTKPSTRACANCQTSNTPFWRKAPRGEGHYCNACGLYFRSHKCDRPSLLATKQAERPLAKSNNQCADCKTFETPLWRRNKMGKIVCNACGLRSRLCDR